MVHHAEKAALSAPLSIRPIDCSANARRRALSDTSPVHAAMAAETVPCCIRASVLLIAILDLLTYETRARQPSSTAATVLFRSRRMVRAMSTFRSCSFCSCSFLLSCSYAMIFA